MKIKFVPIKFMSLFVLTFFIFKSCDFKEYEKEHHDLLKEKTANNVGNYKTNELENSYENFHRPTLIDTGVFRGPEDNYTVNHYQINAFSEIDTTDIGFYKKWSDSVLSVINGGDRSIVVFCSDKEGTPKINTTGLVDSWKYEKYCFLMIEYKGDTFEFYWNPFDSFEK